MSSGSKAFGCAMAVLLTISIGIALTTGAGGAEERKQKYCPVTTEIEINPDFFTDYEGKRVYFCCGMCRTKFLKGPDKYVANLSQLNVAVIGDSKDQSEDEPEHSAGIGEFLAGFHPIAVHFPIALVIVAALAELVFLWTKQPWIEGAARFCVIIGAIGALGAIVTGLLAEQSSSYRGIYASILEKHEGLGITSVIVIILTAVLSEAARWKDDARLRLAFRIALLISVVLIGATGYYGGRLVHG